MSEILPSNLELLEACPSKTSRVTPEAPPPSWGAEGEKVITELEGRGDKVIEEEVVSSEKLEPATLQWPGDRGVGGESEMAEKGGNGRGPGGVSEDERRSLHSVCTSLQGGESRTESERELGLGADRRTGDEWRPVENGLQDPRPRKRGEKDQVEIKLDEELEDNINSLPQKAAQIFNPSITVLQSSSAPTSPRYRDAFWDVHTEKRPILWDVHTEKSPILFPQGTPPDSYYYDMHTEGRSSKCSCDCVNRDALKVGVSVFTAALIFPLLVWGGYVFLPFDAPLLDSAPLRLVYTLRCSVFAVVPIVLGWLVLGISRMRSGVMKPLPGGVAESREVGVHRRYVDDSVTLFLLYFVQLAVLAPYLTQEMVKLVPLLTIVFAFGRLVYWVAAALGSSFRGFGFGLSFLPTVVMLCANLYFMFTLDSEGTIFAQDVGPQQDPTPATRQRFWG